MHPFCNFFYEVWKHLDKLIASPKSLLALYLFCTAFVQKWLVANEDLALTKALTILVEYTLVFNDPTDKCLEALSKSIFWMVDSSLHQILALPIRCQTMSD